MDYDDERRSSTLGPLPGDLTTGFTVDLHAERLDCENIGR